MESSDDDGDPAAVRYASTMLFALVFLFACQKPSTALKKTVSKDTAVVAVKEQPPGSSLIHM
jgi:hypothetical protein